MKKFEPHYRLVRYGLASKIEKASRQQRTYDPLALQWRVFALLQGGLEVDVYLYLCRQAKEESCEDCERNGEREGCNEGQEEVVVTSANCGGYVVPDRHRSYRNKHSPRGPCSLRSNDGSIF